MLLDKERTIVSADQGYLERQPDWTACRLYIKNAKKYLILKKMSDTRDQPGRSMHADIEDL